VLFAAIFLGDPVTAVQLVGYAVSLGGFVYYNYLKTYGLAGTE
jgi:hypothetical protein